MNLTNAQMAAGLEELIQGIDESLENGWRVLQQLGLGDEQRQLDFELNEEIKERASA
ncbi:hypothetical protein [Paenibacillus periandrae]|uniref:hypothetical protein n=1 Tax=Paenibacillus periandrae TaxID=1761741 RepID=UPI001F09B891|nr:hypothetical protein [Paenibacillus periandrae]